LRRVARRLLALDERGRREAVIQLTVVAQTDARSRLVRKLFGMAARADGERRERALEAACVLGSSAVRPLARAMRRDYDDELRVRLVGLLARFGKMLGPRRIDQLMVYLLTVGARSRSQELKNAVAVALQELARCE
jgi:hypothetical protein